MRKLTFILLLDKIRKLHIFPNKCITLHSGTFGLINWYTGHQKWVHWILLI